MSAHTHEHDFPLVPANSGLVAESAPPRRAPDSRSAHEGGRWRARIEPGTVDLWLAFKRTGDRRHRERLILHYSPLVAHVAGRVSVGLPVPVERADLISSGMFGLIDAIERFDLDRSVRFETYATSRIRGAIFDDLRAMDWIPRSIRDKARDVRHACCQLEGRLRRTPSEAEIARELGIPCRELRGIVDQMAFVRVAALDELVRSSAEMGRLSLKDTLHDLDAADPARSLESAEVRRTIASVIEQLPDRERRIIVLYYYEERTLAQIGRILGVTESRVCQLHMRAVLQLRAKLLKSQLWP